MGEISKQIENFKKNTPNDTPSKKKKKRKSKHSKDKLHHKSPKKTYSPHIHAHQPYHSPHRMPLHHSPYDQDITRPQLDIATHSGSTGRNHSMRTMIWLMSMNMR